MRYLLALGSLALLGAGVFATLRTHATEPAAIPEDRWVGAYLKLGRYEIDRTGQFGEAPTITIRKEGDIYKLSKPYDVWKFKETKKGVLEDAPGGIGSIKLGTMEFSDGTRGRILRADFCYETFYLFGGMETKKPGPVRQKQVP
jgi:hypothetical protein